MKWFLLFYVWTLANLVVADKNFTFTFDMAMQCREHRCQHGYSYETYYRVDSDDLRQVKTSPDVMFEMHIAILAASNGHILLSTVPQPTIADPVYEIVVGGGGNRFTELRRNLRRNARASTKTVGILSAVEFRAFYIKITEDGLIEFGREGEILPVISYQDVHPLTIRYFSFAAWNGVEASFLYDCPQAGAKRNSVTPNSEPIEQPLSNSDSLKKTLLLYKDPFISPAPKVNVNLGIQINSVNYNALEAELITGMSIIANWIDDSMAWNPAKFNNTARLNFREGQIWNPKFFVYNSDGNTMLNPQRPEPIMMINNGEATYHFQTQVKTWCTASEVKINRWPKDEYKCYIVIEPWESHEKIGLNILSPSHSARQLFTDFDKIVLNGWDVSTQDIILNSSMWTGVYSSNITHQSDRYQITLFLKRQASAFNIVFYIPLIVLFTFVLMSFWTEPLTLSRVWFYASCTIVICMVLCYMDLLVPCFTVPSILILYVTVLNGVLIALLVQVSLMTQVAGSLCKSVLVQNLLTLQCLRTLFCLPLLKTVQIYESINEICATPDDDDSGVAGFSRNGTIEEMQSDKVEYSEKKEVAEIIDKIMFFVYTVVFAVMLALHY